MAYLNCTSCEGDGFTPHYIKNESERTIQYFARRCPCDRGPGTPFLVREGETVIDEETFRRLESEGYRRTHNRREMP